MNGVQLYIKTYIAFNEDYLKSHLSVESAEGLLHIVMRCMHTYTVEVAVTWLAL